MLRAGKCGQLLQSESWAKKKRRDGLWSTILQPKEFREKKVVSETGSTGTQLTIDKEEAGFQTT